MLKALPLLAAIVGLTLLVTVQVRLLQRDATGRPVPRLLTRAAAGASVLAMVLLLLRFALL